MLHVGAEIGWTTYYMYMISDGNDKYVCRTSFLCHIDTIGGRYKSINKQYEKMNNCLPRYCISVDIQIFFHYHFRHFFLCICPFVYSVVAQL